jgi:hypothetical protein
MTIAIVAITINDDRVPATAEFILRIYLSNEAASIQQPSTLTWQKTWLMKPEDGRGCENRVWK